ncbi:hypothetical protein LOTGIDRAFT_174357 [Lottia gigantea]|uniref:Mutator-like transposase domain-containing protein n=1 Tax=Lottia gigantea TaxID=225164 RepID=V4AX27_LOTGI|nr:hypothetical protein LOTGIDRAFT_174357 [Lottia gigantea]ESO98101.1 hypothetical protein LOTGIDRAFT_174357 [Lottia gigantea]
MGLATRKLLHIGIRKKHCYICDSAKNHHMDPVEHEFFKNWEDSSQAMESDIIVDGFLNAEQDHSIRYMRIVADGGSSVFARIQETVPIWGPHVSKLECANHVCNCLRSSLEKLVDRLPSLKGKSKLTLATRIRIVSAVRCAIRMRSSDGQDPRRTRKLEHDIKNSIFHIFGKHDNCSEFCLKSAAVSNNIPSTYSVAADEEKDSVISVLDDQMQFWSDGVSLQSQEESRVAVEHRDLTPIQTNIVKEVQPLLNRVAAKAGRLLGNFTTNLAESWMHIMSKFDGGKFYNRCHRGSCNARERKVQTGRLLSARPVVKARRWKRKSAGKCNTQKAEHEYGPNAVDVVPDFSQDVLAKKCDSIKKTLW